MVELITNSTTPIGHEVFHALRLACRSPSVAHIFARNKVCLTAEALLF